MPIRPPGGPTAVVQLDATDPFADTDAEWFRLATAHGLFGEDGGFLVTLGHGGCFRVRLGKDWRLAEVLRNQPRCPEFMTLSPDGKTLIGVTTEEYEIRLIVVDDVPAYQEQRALRLAREESEEEREAAWDGLFRLRIPQQTRERWAIGLLTNASLPDDLRLDLVVRTGRYYGHDLPADLIDQLLLHPDWKVRSALVDTGTNQLTPGQWSRLVLSEENDRRRWALVSVTVDYGATFTTAAYERLAADPVPRVRAEAAALTGLPVTVARALLTDPEPQVRRSACPAA